MADELDPRVSQQVSQRYRELGAEQPPHALERSILDAARRATDKPHAPLVTPAGRHRWYFSLAAAAILVMAVAITWQIERVQPDVETVALRSEVETKPIEPKAAEQAKETAPPAAATGSDARERQFASEPKRKIQQAPPEAARDAAAAASSPAESRMRENAAGDVARAEASRAPAPAAAAPPSDLFSRRADVASRAEPQAPPQSADAESGGVAVQGPRAAAESPDMARQRARARTEARPAEPAPRAAPGPQTNALGSIAGYVDNPERFLERIADLRKQGKHNEADQALAEFKSRYPDYRISEEMLQKVERKK